jgi:hypothetical protein
MDVFSPCGGNCSTACKTNTLVLLIYDPYALVAASVSFENGKGVVFGVIIDANHFPFLESLGEQGIKAIGNIYCAIVTRDDYRYCE